MQQFEKLEVGKFYHIYPRGIKAKISFWMGLDYGRFIFKFEKYLQEVLDIYAYCLMSNHFHSTVQIKEDLLLPRFGGDDFVNRLNTC